MATTILWGMLDGMLIIEERGSLAFAEISFETLIGVAFLKGPVQ